MADTRLSDLSAAGALSASDLFYVVQTPGSGGEKATGAQLLTLVGTNYLAKAGGTMTGALTIASGTLTASAPALSITQTWNGSGVSFRGIDVNITNTLSALSYPVVVSVNAANIFYVSSTGDLYANNFRTTSNSGSFGIGGTADVLLYRDAAATLALRNGTTQQIFRLYNTADAGLANYERLTLTGVAGTSVNITAESLGTGAANLDVVLTSKGTGSYKFGTVASFSPTGYLISPGALLSTIFSVNYYSSTIRIGGSADLGWSSTASVASAPDVALRRSAAGVLDLDSGTSTQYRDLKLRNLIQTEYSQLTEMTAPSAPAANSVRIYAEDNGAGKTRLMALFATGAAQQIAIEP